MFLNCTSHDYGLITFLHEAVHFEDQGYPHLATIQEIESWHREGKKFPFNLFDIRGNKHEEMQLSRAPKPQDLILRFFDKYHPDVVRSEEHEMQSFFEYLTDPETNSSSQFTKGLVTELNAYAHGLRFESRLNPEFRLGHRKGLFAFLIFFKAYFHEAKSDATLWEELNLKTNAQQIKVLFEQAAFVLELTDHCKTMSGIEKKQFFEILADQRTVGPLQELLKDTLVLKKILCE